MDPTAPFAAMHERPVRICRHVVPTRRHTFVSLHMLIASMQYEGCDIQRLYDALLFHGYCTRFVASKLGCVHLQ